MNAETMTFSQIRIRGIDALKRELGAVGMVRFLQQFETGHGDYSKDRHKTLDTLGLDAVIKSIEKRRNR